VAARPPAPRSWPVTATCHAYALGLAKAGVPIELHVHPGAPHGFERFVPGAGVARRAMADRVRAVATI
jgi:acetyl esterase/lipase